MIRKTNRWVFTAGILLVLTIVAGCGQDAGRKADPPESSSSGLASYTDYLKQEAAAGRFSGVVLVAKDGKPVLEQGYGMADKAHSLPNTPQTKFCIASMGKMFTAVAIAQLIEQGKLSFSDPIGKYVSGFPPEIADNVTIHDLLTHTSGMGDAALGREPGVQPATELADMVVRIAEQPLQFPPGERFSYSNDGFIVLGAILERVTGQKYADYIQEHIFAPAGMADTAISNYQPSKIPNMAHGYLRVGEDGRPLPPGPGPNPQSSRLQENGDMIQVANPSGGAYSTAADMLAFAKVLTNHKLLSPSMTDTLLAGKVDSQRPGGPPQDKYAYGFSDQRINGVRIVGHNGGTPGYEGQLDIYPNKNYVVVILTNQDGTLVPAIRKSEDLLTQ